MRKQAGQTLLEISLAFGVTILVLSAIIVAVTTSLSNTQYTKNQNLANSYAKEAIEVVRGLRDSNWPKFSQYKTNTIYCLPPNSTELIPASPKQICTGDPVGGIFFREVVFVHTSSDCSAGTPPTPTPTPAIIGTKITVKVSWSDSRCSVGNPICHKVELISCFSNTNQRQAP